MGVSCKRFFTTSKIDQNSSEKEIRTLFRRKSEPFKGLNQETFLENFSIQHQKWFLEIMILRNNVETLTVNVLFVILQGSDWSTKRTSILQFDLFFHALENWVWEEPKQNSSNLTEKPLQPRRKKT